MAAESARHAIDTMFLEERRYPPHDDFAARANAQADIYSQELDELWEREGRERVTWFEPFTKLYEWEPPYAKWYLGGELNVCFNCVARHVEAGDGGVVAYDWEGEPVGERREVSYADLQKDVVRFANVLRKLGVEKGTPVGIYMGMVPECDGARIESDADFWLLGRVDDVMNVSGHRISTIEVESALVDHSDVAEAAVCSRADATTGEATVAYVTLKAGREGDLEKLAELREHVARKIGPIAKPANIVFTPELPKTRSGKIVRRLLRDAANNRRLGDTTTLADPTVVSEIQSRAAGERSQEAET